MNKEELASELYGKIVNQDFIPDIITVERIAEYLLEHYHLVPKSTKCYEGTITKEIDDEGEEYIGFIPSESFIEMTKLDVLLARIFIEEEKCE